MATPHTVKKIPPLGLGCWVFDPAAWQGRYDPELMETMQDALQAGVTHFDTAAGYGSGYSERLVGRFLQGRRAQVFLATKGGIESEDPRRMLAGVRRSLERLQTGFVDLYYIHWPSSDLDLRPAVEGLELARREGLIGAIGVSNFSVEQIDAASEAGQIDALQIGYNLLWRRPEQELLPYCLAHRIPVIAYSSIAMGILTGKFPRHPQIGSGDMRRGGIILFQEPAWGAIWEAVEEMKTIAVEVGRPLQHLAIRWVLSRPGVTSVLVGARSPAQVRENAAAMQGEVPAVALERMDAISNELRRVLPDQETMYGNSS